MHTGLFDHRPCTGIFHVMTGQVLICQCLSIIKGIGKAFLGKEDTSSGDITKVFYLIRELALVFNELNRTGLCKQR